MASHLHRKMEPLCNGKETPETMDEGQQESKRWRSVLRHILKLILVLAKQGIPFRDPEEEDEDSEEESLPLVKQRNVFAFLELLSDSDPVLKEVLESFEHGSDSQERLLSYLSRQAEEEFVRLLGNDIKEQIVADVKKAKYFGILFDTALDAGQDEHICEVFRYVHIEGGKVEVRESFLGFFPVTRKPAAEVTEVVLRQLDSDGLDINLCRSQGYDNFAEMAGYHGEMRAKMNEANPKSVFVPCAYYSLNLCGLRCFQRVTCVLEPLESVFSFFSPTPYLWEMLERVGVTAKRCPQTNWSAHYEAVSAVKANLESLISTLEELCKPHQSYDMRTRASPLLDQVCDFSFVCFLFFWRDVLEEIDLTQRYLQKFAISLEQCTMKAQALKSFLEEHRTRMVENAISYATTKCKEMDIPIEEAVSFRKKPGAAAAANAELEFPEKIKWKLFKCLDGFLQELDIRRQAMENIRSVFAIVQPLSLIVAEEKALRKLLPSITETYDELSGEDMVKEIFRLREHLKDVRGDLEEAKKWTALQFLEFIVQSGFMESVPNLALCLRLFLTVCVSRVSCERDISKVELIKSVLRTKESPDRLRILAILAVERERTKKIDFDKVIDKFTDANPPEDTLRVLG